MKDGSLDNDPIRVWECLTASATRGYDKAISSLEAVSAGLEPDEIVDSAIRKYVEWSFAENVPTEEYRVFAKNWIKDHAGSGGVVERLFQDE